MENIQDKVRRIRQEKGLTQNQLSNKAGLNVGYIAKFETKQSGYERPSLEIIEAIAKALEVHPSELLYGFSEKKLHELHKELNGVKEVKLLPVIGKVCCGWKDFGDLDYPANNAEEFLPGFTTKDPEAFYVKAEGDSMIDGDIQEGDYLLIEPNARVTNGCKVLAKEPRHGCTIKLFYKEKDGRIRLQPMNPQYSPIYIESGEDFRVYKVSGKFTKY